MVIIEELIVVIKPVSEVNLFLRGNIYERWQRLVVNVSTLRKGKNVVILESMLRIS